MTPKTTRFVVVGAGVHGLSVAIHLAERLTERGEDATDVLVLDKQRIGAGATGISGGIVRNFYLSAAMNELVRLSVEIFELDPGLFGFRQVGYVAVVPEVQAAELARIADQHAAIGYTSTLVTGGDDVATHMRGVFPDWKAPGLTALLHEERSGWADPAATLAALAGMARAAGARIVEGVEVLGFDTTAGTVTGVETATGPIACEAVVLAPGPWARDFWPLLDLPPLEPAGEDLVTQCYKGTSTGGRTFHYWEVREGDYAHPSAALGARDPVVHLDADVPLRGPDGDVLYPAPWGVYLRPSIGGGVAVGGLPGELEPDCELDPYGPSHPTNGSTPNGFDETMTSALAFALGRFAEADPSGWTMSSFAAPTCFTPDSYPVVGRLRDGVYGILDSNHGFKMLALGQLAAAELLGDHAPELDAFRPERFAAAAIHPSSASPYPWT